VFGQRTPEIPSSLSSRSPELNHELCWDYIF
jgi:hypothetical protein